MASLLCIPQTDTMSQIVESKELSSPIHEGLLQQQLDLQGLKLTPDGFVHWKPGNRRHPRNWSKLRKAHDVTVILLLEMFTYVALLMPGAKLTFAGRWSVQQEYVTHWSYKMVRAC
jgi:hypothetical protein